MRREENVEAVKNIILYWYKFLDLPSMGVFCSLVMLWLIAHGMVRYLVNDDTYIALATSGAYGKQYPYTLFTNIVLGYLLCFLYKISPYHNWMTLISLGSIFGGYVTLGVFSWYKKR